MSQDEQEPKAVDLLPPEEDKAQDPSRPIAARRVAGWSTSDRLLSRTIRRPAGNSRGFWSRIEDDDPFARRRPRRPEHIGHHEVYASDRLVRVEDGRAVPARPSNPTPQAQRPAPPPPPPKPTPQPQAKAAAPPAEEPVAAPPIDRRPPRIAHNPKGSRRTGRVPVRREGPQGEGTQPVSTAAEIRAAKEAARKASEPEAPPQLRNIDNILGVFGDLAAAQQVFEENEARAKSGQPPLEEPAYTPEPRPAPRPARQAAEPPEPEPVPPQDTPTPDRTPPGSKSKGMDDLFGGGTEGRVRIGKRNKPKS